jgi:hypothetical protein
LISDAIIGKIVVDFGYPKAYTNPMTKTSQELILNLLKQKLSCVEDGLYCAKLEMNNKGTQYRFPDDGSLAKYINRLEAKKQSILCAIQEIDNS